MRLPLLLVFVVPVIVTLFQVHEGFQPQAQYEQTLWNSLFRHPPFRSNFLPDAENLPGTTDE
jgi:hypothetical protein